MERYRLKLICLSVVLLCLTFLAATAFSYFWFPAGNKWLLLACLIFLFLALSSFISTLVILFLPLLRKLMQKNKKQSDH
ncbi:hypothetical protein AALT52_00145 [Ligilactobacillus faecis]|uniref:Uncharacterized protein n=1 Tax=Ligilactobacillus faecis TaxID=762833 RepID=A0ABV4DLE4_9LACO